MFTDVRYLDVENICILVIHHQRELECFAYSSL